MERRSKFRWPTNAVVRSRGPAGPDQAIIQDISIGGCRIATENSILQHGATILLNLTGKCATVGRVMWAMRATAGIKFESEITQAIVETFNEPGRRAIAVSFPFAKHNDDGPTSIPD